VDLFPTGEDFPVKKGDIIAYSGNSGSSSGPHLHFEIRDKNQHVLDPSRMDFKELKDNIPPVLIKVAFISKSPNGRINGQFGRFEFDAIAKADGTFSLKKSISLSGPVGIEIYAYDKANGTRNSYGIPDLEGRIDDELFFTQNIRNISYAKMRNILVHTNYQNSARGGRRFNKLYKDDGNSLNFYPKLKDNGIINFEVDEPKQLEIIMKDPYGNISKFALKVNSTIKKYPNGLVGEKNPRDLQVIDNTLKVFVSDQGNTHLLEVFANNHSYQIPPEYVTNKGSIYLWDLCYGLPDSIDFCSEVKQLDFLQSFFPGQQASFYHPTASINFSKNTLFDTLHLKYHYRYDSSFEKEVFHFKNAEDPLKASVNIAFKPAGDYDKNYARIYSMYKSGKTSYIGGKWSGEEIKFRTRDLVRYTIDYDTIVPTTKPLKISQNKISLTINDDKSGIRSYKATLNGKWLLLKYDYKRKKLETDPLDPNIPFTGELLVEVKDNTGNKSNFETKID